VVFGHMHCHLQYPRGKQRIMIRQDCKTNTIYVNTAQVPRIMDISNVPPHVERCHHFTVAEFDGTKLASIESIWVAVSCGSGECRVLQKQDLMRLRGGSLQLWNDYTESWEAARCR
jgi:hypothetical protein